MHEAGGDRLIPARAMHEAGGDRLIRVRRAYLVSG